MCAHAGVGTHTDLSLSCSCKHTYPLWLPSAAHSCERLEYTPFRLSPSPASVAPLGLMSSLFSSDKSFLYGSQDSVRNAKHKPPVPVLLSRNRACFVGWLNSPHANLSSILKTDVWFSHAASSEQLAWVSASHAG